MSTLQNVRETTIRDVANALDISHSTVSRALRGKPGVGDELVARIKAAATAMGYVPNLSARDLRGSPSELVGLVVPDLRNDLWGELTKHLAVELLDRGYKLILADTNEDSALELLQVRSLRAARVGGIIIAPASQLANETADLLTQMQTVQIIRDSSRCAAPVVTFDMRESVRQAVQHLGEFGHRRIAFVGAGRDYLVGVEGALGFAEATREWDECLQEYQHFGVPSAKFGETATRILLAKPTPPTGIVFASPEMCRGGLKAIQAAGIDVPNDLSIIAHHDPAWFEIWGAGITTIAIPLRELARVSVKTLFGESVGIGFPSEAGAGIIVRLSTELVIRGTVTIPREDMTLTITRNRSRSVP